VSAPAPALRQGGGAQTKSRRVFGNGLVVAQVAISLALLSVAQLYTGHLRHLRDRSLGFDRDRVLLMSVNTSRAQNREQLAALYRDVVARLHAIPGVDSVAASGMTPMSGGAGSAFLRVEGFDEPAHDRQRVSLNTVSPNYFLTYGTPLLAGRDFRDSDMDQPRRIIVNQALARKYFPGRDPLGRHVWLENESDPYEIVGVAGAAKYNDVRLPSPPIAYQFALMSRGSSDLSLRTSGRRAGFADAARRVIDHVVEDGRSEPRLEECRQLLEAYGVAFPTAVEASPATAVETANAIGYPVAIKAVRRRPGRSARSGVALDIASASAAHRAVDTIVEALGTDADELIIQSMASPGVDLRVHCEYDERLGAIVSVGLGGAQAEVIADRTSRLAPVSPAVARTMLGETRVLAALVEADIDPSAVVDIIVQAAQLASDHHRVRDLDLNPVIASSDGIVVTDAMIRLDDDDADGDSLIRKLV